jgi:dihydrodipicolinate synthase/N-acetylneuraminate lyase
MNDNTFALAQAIRGGVLPAMATPLSDDGYQVDVDAVPRLVEFLIAAGVSGLFVGGTTGEGILLDVSQRMTLHETAAGALAGRVPLLLHVGTNNTRDTQTLIDHAKATGADGIVVITPTFYGLPDDVLLDYFRAMALRAGSTPFLVYDIPHMAINGVSATLLEQLRRSVSNFAGIKCSRPDAQVVRQLIDVADGEALVLAGNERIALGSLALGATGIISGLATAIPEPFVAMAKAFVSGDLERARGEQQRINRLLDLLPAGQRIGAIKLILEQRGIIPTGRPVPPRRMPTAPELWQQLSTLLH